MTADNPGMTKRSSRVQGGGNGEAEATDATEAGTESPARHPAEAGVEGERPAALDEILRHLRQLTGRVEGTPKRETESPKEESRLPAGAAGVRESGNVQPPVSNAPVGAAAEIARALNIQRADFGKWVEMQRRARCRWAGLAIAAGLPAALMLGVLVQLQFQVIPLHDPTGGWRGHVWENYGRRIVDCAVEAMATNAEVDCPLVVRRP